MSTTHYSPSRSGITTEEYVRGQKDERVAAMSTDVPGGPGAFGLRAHALAQAHGREVEVAHYRQSFSDKEFSPDDPHDVQKVNDLGYELAKEMHPNADCLVVTHLDGVGRKPHNHILVINHDRETDRALENYRSFYDRKNTRGVQSANDRVMERHGLQVLERGKHLAPKDWELRREDFAEDSLDRQMGDRFQAALMDPRAVDRQGLEEVIAEQNQDDSLPKMRLHSSTRKKGKDQGKETWTLYIEDHRDEAKRPEHRKRCSALSADFTPEGAQAIFDFHHQQRLQKEKEDERNARAAAAAERAAADVTEHRGHGTPGAGDRDPGAAAGRDRGDSAGDAPAVDLAAVRERAREQRELREAAQRDREDAERARRESEWRRLNDRFRGAGEDGREAGEDRGLRL